MTRVLGSGTHIGSPLCSVAGSRLKKGDFLKGHLSTCSGNVKHTHPSSKQFYMYAAVYGAEMFIVALSLKTQKTLETTQMWSWLKYATEFCSKVGTLMWTDSPGHTGGAEKKQRAEQSINDTCVEIGPERLEPEGLLWSPRGGIG